MWVGLQVKCKPPLTHVVIEVGGQFAGSIGIELQDLTDVHRHSAELGYCACPLPRPRLLPDARLTVHGLAWLCRAGP